jgi:hypothetical protein
MRKWFLLSLTILVMTAYFVFCFSRLPDLSVRKWREETGYKGDICVVAVDKSNKPYCANHVTYTKASVNAYEGYSIWVACKQYPNLAICSDI